MKFVRKSIALLLALVMVLALSTAAFAAPVTEMQGVTLNYGIPSAYQFVRNNEAGAITKNVGDTGFYYRLPRSTYLCPNCKRVVSEFIPDYYAVDRVDRTAGYSLSDPSVLTDCEYSLAAAPSADEFNGYVGRPCLEFHYKAAKPGRTTVTLTFYYNYNIPYESGYCDYCWYPVYHDMDQTWYKETTTFTVIVTGEEETDYALTYDTNGGKEANWTDTQSTTTGYATFTVSSTVPTRDGYTFLGWADCADATAATYHAGNSVVLTKDAPAKTIYAVWQKNPTIYDYTLIYDVNGGNEENRTDTKQSTDDSVEFTVSDFAPTQDGYTFLGWADTADATAPIYQAGNSVTLTKENPVKTIYAVWQQEADKYTVEFQYPAGTTYQTFEVEEGETVTTLGAETFYEGEYDEENFWKLTGWQDEVGTVYGLEETITVHGNLVLTPVVDHALLLCDGPTGNVMGILYESQYQAGRNDLLAETLSYTSPMAYTVLPGGDRGFTVNGTRKTVIGMETNTDYTFAGWFFAPGNAEGQVINNRNLDWTAANNVGAADLFDCAQVENHRIYAYWIYADYSQPQIGYRADSRYAREVYINATVPKDMFQHYGFVVSTAATEEDQENLVIGGVIGGKPVGNYQKTAVYETFQASPIYEEAYTAQDFNAGLPGYDGNGAGYITYFYWRNMQLKNASGNLTTLSARAYYRTLEGTLVYGDMTQVTFEPDTTYNPLESTSPF